MKAELTTRMDGLHLPDMVVLAATSLAKAETAAEVLDARDAARFVYDAAKSAARIHRAKEAHGEIIKAVLRAQADALLIEAAAARRFADEYDAAQEAGEVATGGRPKTVPGENGLAPATAAEVGVTRKDIHDARAIRDAEEADPGVVKRTLDNILDRGEEPTRAALKSAIRKPRRTARPQVDPQAMWFWGRMSNFEDEKIMEVDPAFLVSTMPDHMRKSLRRIIPQLVDFLHSLEEQL